MLISSQTNSNQTNSNWFHITQIIKSKWLTFEVRLLLYWTILPIFHIIPWTLFSTWIMWPIGPHKVQVPGIACVRALQIPHQRHQTKKINT